MPTYENKKYLSLPEQVQKNKNDIVIINDTIANVGVGPQGVQGPQGAQGVQGNIGPAGPDGTPVAGTTLNAIQDATLGNVYTVELTTSVSSGQSKRFVFGVETLGSFAPELALYIDGVLNAKKVSTLDFFSIRNVSGNYRIQFYDEVGEAVELITGTVSSIKISTGSTTNGIALYELLNGSTVGPTGPAGAQGIQGIQGPQGPQGVQGLPGVKNITYLDTFEHLDTFAGFNYRVMVQIIGGDYDGLTFMKETFVDGDTCKFGPYGSLVTLTDVVGSIEITLGLGVTSIRVYKVDNIT